MSLTMMKGTWFSLQGCAINVMLEQEGEGEREESSCLGLFVTQRRVV